ncbi:SDR family NAD(P)-dependent oxidoreductase, partial [Colwellia echini]
ADKTGYPTEMLELGMDMEADLGIDSIKRVEILGAVQEIITDLPELNPEDLAELRTLGEIVSYMQGKVTAVSNVVSQTPDIQVKTVSEVTIDLDHIQTVMMEVVADKTGYPTEMLELGMDMEADLGIDSIKRVEILGAVQEIITDLPELNPEDLAELRTLGEIVKHMQDKMHGGLPPIPPTEPPSDKKPKEIKSFEKNTTIVNIVNPAPSATVALQPLSSITKIAQDFTNHDIAQQPNVLLVDDGSDTAILVSEKLIIDGWQVTVLKPNWLRANINEKTKEKVSNKIKNQFNKAVNVIDIGSKDNTIDEAQVSQILQQHAQFDAVIYLQENSQFGGEENDELVYSNAAKQGLMLAFVLAKHCNVKSATNARASFMVVTKQGGALGFTDTENAETLVKANLQTDLVQGGLSGLVKTLSHEWSGQADNESAVFCRLVDLSDTLAAESAASIIYDELFDLDGSLIEVAYDTDNLSHKLSDNSSNNSSNYIGSRLTLVGEQTDSYSLAQNNSNSSTNSANNLNTTPITQDSVFLVSGGAKGVTAHCVIEIAKQHKSTFILVGRSPLLASNEKHEPSWASGHQDEVALKKAAMQVLIASGEKPTPVKVSDFVRPILANREIIQTLNAIKLAGGQAKYVAADVTNSESVHAAVEPAIKALGLTGCNAITGIIHGAGVLADKFIEQKTLQEFEAVYSTKIDGLQSLLSVCQIENIKHLVLFSSAAGFYGNPGQSDYSIANEILNKTAYRFKAQYPNTQVLSFNWGPWDGGMVTPELKRMFDARGVYIIPLDAGAKLLVKELNASSNRCAQILVGNDLSKDSGVGTVNDTVPVDDSVKKSLVSRLPKAVSVFKTLQVTNNPFLADHVINQEQVLPTVCALAWMSEAVTNAYPAYQLQSINNYKLLKGVTFDSKAQSKDFTIALSFEDAQEANTQGANTQETNIKENNTQIVNCKISSLNEETGKTVFHYSAQLVLTDNSANKDNLVTKIDTNFINGLTAKVETKLTDKTAKNANDLYQNGTLFHGESLQGIIQLIECNEQGLLLGCKVPLIAEQKQGEFALDIKSSNNTNSFANIFANDLAYQAMLVWVKRELGLGSLPSSTQAWQIYEQIEINKAFYIQLKVVKSSGKGANRGNLVADINFINEAGEILAEIKSAKVTASESLNDMFLPVEMAGITK